MRRRFPYWQLLVVPYLCYLLGWGANVAALAANHQRMPVRYLICTPDLLDDADLLHTCWTNDTRLKPLTDWIRIAHPDTGGIKFISVGDILLDIYEEFWGIGLIVWIVLMLRDRYLGIT